MLHFVGKAAFNMKTHCSKREFPPLFLDNAICGFSASSDLTGGTIRGCCWIRQMKPPVALMTLLLPIFTLSNW